LLPLAIICGVVKGKAAKNISPVKEPVFLSTANLLPIFKLF
jgi:hypothetical protein